MKRGPERGGSCGTAERRRRGGRGCLDLPVVRLEGDLSRCSRKKSCYNQLLNQARVGYLTDLQDPVAKRVTIKGLDGHQGLLVVRHRDEAEALAFISL